MSDFYLAFIYIKDINQNTSIIHLKTEEEILKFLIRNPMWLSGFVCGEGCFTGYLSIDKRRLWGLQPGLGFSITQSTDDKALLKSVNIYFNKKGDVDDKPNNVSVFAVTKVKVLKEIIIPFFNQYPLIGKKAYEFEQWKKLVDIYYFKNHTGKSDTSKENILKFAEILKELNLRHINNNKLKRMDIIINWLKDLNDFPTINDKSKLVTLIKKN